MNWRNSTRLARVLLIVCLVVAGVVPASTARATAQPAPPPADVTAPHPHTTASTAAGDDAPQGAAPEITASARVVRNGDPVLITLKNGLPGHKGYFVAKAESLEFWCGAWKKRCEQTVSNRGDDLTIQARNTGGAGRLDVVINFYDMNVNALLPAGVLVRFYSGANPPDPPPPAQPEISYNNLDDYAGGFYLEGIEVIWLLSTCVNMKGQTGSVEFVLNGTTVYRETVNDHGCPQLRVNLGNLHGTGSGVKSDRPANGQYTFQITAYNPSGASKTVTGALIQVPFKAEWFKDMVWLEPVAFHKGSNPYYELAVKLPLKGYQLGAPGFIRNNGSADTRAGFVFRGTLEFPVKCRENYAITGRADVDASFATVYVVNVGGHAHGDSHLELNFRGCQLLGAQLKGGLYASGEGSGDKEVKLMDLLVDFLLDPGWINSFVKWLGNKWTNPSASVAASLTLRPGVNAEATLSPMRPYLTSSVYSNNVLQIVTRYNQTFFGSTVELDFRLGGAGRASFDKDGLQEVDNLPFRAEIGYTARFHGRILNVWMPTDAYTVGAVCQYPPYAPNESCRKKPGSAVAGSPAGQFMAIGHPPGDDYARFVGNVLPEAWSTLGAGQNPVTTMLVSNVYTYTTSALAIDPAGGQSLLLWDHDDIAKPVGQSLELHFSRWDGAAWSTPAPVTDDTYQDITPQVAWAAGGEAVALWQRSAQAVSAAGTVADDFLNDFEIATATYLTATNQWSAPVALTANEVADFAPSLARSPDGRLLAAWQRFTASAGLEATGPGDILAAFYDGGWGAPAVAVAAVPQLSEVAAGYGVGSATIAFTRLVTPAGTVTPTHQVWTTAWDGANWPAPQPLTADTLEHTQLNLLYNAANEPLLVWMAGDVLQLRNLANGSGAVYPVGDAFGIQDSLRVVQDSQGNLAALFRDQIRQTDLYVAFFDQASGRWGRPRPLTKGDSMERGMAPAFDAGDALQVAYAATTQVETEQAVTLDGDETVTYTVAADGPTHLNLLRYTFSPSMTIPAGGLQIDVAAPAPGSVVALTGVVENSGDLPLEAVTVAFYDGAPDAGGALIGRSTAPGFLVAGERITVTVPYLVLGEGGIRTVYLQATAGNLAQTAALAATPANLRVLGPNLGIVAATVEPDILGNSFLGAAVFNRGTTTSGPTTVQFRHAAITGTVAAVANVPALGPGELYTATVLWDHSALPAGDVPLVAFINDGDFEELDRSDNHAPLTVAAGPDLAFTPYDLAIGPAVAGMVPVTVTLRNLGAVAAGNAALHFHSGWALDATTLVMTATVPALAAGAAMEIAVPVPGPLTCGLFVVVGNDGGRDVDWSNNVVSQIGASTCASRAYLPSIATQGR